MEEEGITIFIRAISNPLEKRMTPTRPPFTYIILGQQHGCRELISVKTKFDANVG